MRFLAILIGGLMTLTAHAQIFKYIGMEDGLCSRRVLALEQDSKGYVWILTHKGADRYDGSTFNNYKLKKDGSDVYFYPDLNTLEADAEGTLWEYGKDGLVFRFDDIKDEFVLVFDLQDAFPNTAGYPISAVYFDQKGYLWFSCDTDIYRYSTVTGESKRVTKEPMESPVYSITSNGKGLFWFTGKETIIKADLRTEGKYDLEETRLNGISQVTFIYYHDGTDRLLINTLLDGLFMLDLATKRLFPLESQLKDIGINAVKPVPGNSYELLLATDGDGVYKLNAKTGELTRFLQEDNEQAGKMNGSIIKDILLDKDGRIWCAIYPTGITVFTDKYPEYKWYRHSDKGNSLVDDRINAIMEDAEGDVWFATSNGISCYHTKTGRWQNFLNEADDDTPCRNRIFISLCEYEPNKVLAGGYMAGAYLLDKRTGHVDQSSLSNVGPGASPDKYMRTILTDLKGVIWGGGYNSMTSFDTVNRQTVQTATIFPIMHIKDRDEETLWVGTINGLYVFNKTSREWTLFDEKMNTGCVNTIYMNDERTVTYVGTYGNGLFVINNETGEYKQFNKDNCGLENNNIYSIVQNKYGDILLGTENGLTIFYQEEERFVSWTKEEGLLAATFNQSAAIRTSSGQLVFGTNEGAVVFPDDTRFNEASISKIILSNLNIMYKAVHPLEEDSPLKLPLDETDKIVLRYDQNTFSLNVSSINFDNPENVWYSWKLEGFFDAWTTPSDFNLIRYTNLSPGTYTLRVRAILMSDDTILEERRMKIVVLRPFWLSFWAFLIYGILAICLIYGWTRYTMIKKIRKVSQEKISFFINTAHDIRTPLTLIKAPLAEMLRNEKLSEQGLVNINLAIQNTDNLSTLANNLMNFQKEELYSSKVLVTKIDLNDYMKGCLEQFGNYAKQKGIELEYVANNEHAEVWIDRNKMDSIMRNLISNALKYTPAGGKVTVSTAVTKSRWYVDVSDTGIGIPRRDQHKMFRLLFRGANATNQQITGSGIGMLLTYRLIKNHQGSISFRSQVNAGTCFHLSFPIESRKYQTKQISQTVTNVQVSGEQKHIVEGVSIVPLQNVEKKSVDDSAPRILIVEDNQSLRVFLMQSLSDTYNVDGAANGQEALEKIAERQPDLVLSDVMMPVMSGEALCAKLKNNIETSHIVVVLLTALADREDIVRGLGTKADLYITKPFDLLVLRANIMTLLDNRKLLREKFASADYKIEETDDDLTKALSELDKEFMNRVETFVKENLAEGLTVDTVCAHINMSRTSFYNKIKALTGIAPNEYIRNIRMHEAGRLLRSQRYTVSEVSDLMGFADPKYFTDTFKKFYGVTPTAYKLKVKSENSETVNRKS